MRVAIDGFMKASLGNAQVHTISTIAEYCTTLCEEPALQPILVVFPRFQVEFNANVHSRDFELSFTFQAAIQA